MLTEKAACREADPSLFDSVGGVLARYALQYCRKCPVVKECEEFVRPKKSFFDGVAGGKVWSNGRRVDILYTTKDDDRLLQ
jgi:WhiB family redox-sensing transcriptional regulator